MKRSLIIAFVFFHGFLYSQNEELMGPWEYRSEVGAFQLEFVNENTLIYNGERSQYSLTENAVRVYDEFGFYFDYLYVLQEKALLLTFPDGIQYTFNRIESKAPSTQNPQNTGGGNVEALFGNVCSFSSSSGGGSSYSSSRRFYFDGKGRFAYSTEGSYSGNGDGYYGNDPNAITGSYGINGNTITFYMDQGGSQSGEIKMIQTWGEITEFQIGSTHYGKGICE